MRERGRGSLSVSQFSLKESNFENWITLDFRGSARFLVIVMVYCMCFLLIDLCFAARYKGSLLCCLVRVFGLLRFSPCLEGRPASGGGEADHVNYRTKKLSFQ